MNHNIRICYVFCGRLLFGFAMFVFALQTSLAEGIEGLFLVSENQEAAAASSQHAIEEKELDSHISLSFTDELGPTSRVYLVTRTHFEELERLWSGEGVPPLSAQEAKMIAAAAEKKPPNQVSYAFLRSRGNVWFYRVGFRDRSLSDDILVLMNGEVLHWVEVGDECIQDGACSGRWLQSARPLDGEG